jgi:hypothetical protein
VGISFHHCPQFKELRGDDTNKQIEDVNLQTLTRKQFEEEVKKQEEKEKKKKQRRKGSRDPSLKEVRDMLKKMIAYHCKSVNDRIPSVYPILGPVNMDDEEEEEGNKGGDGQERGGLGMSNTKGELRRYNN